MTEPPARYRLHTAVDLKRDPKIAAAIRSVVVLVAIGAVGLAFALDLPTGGSWSTWTTVAATVTACLVYMAVHELTHGAVLRVITGARPRFALRFPYLVTGSRAYLGRRAGIVVALAPGVVWGAVLVVLLVTLPPPFFLTVYIVTALNFASSAGDYLQAYAFSRLPGTALIQDDGAVTRVFLPAT